jgi:hypothetical protein
MVALFLPCQNEPNTEPERSRVRFGLALVGLGYIFYLDGVLNLIAFAGFAWTDVLDKVFPIGAAPDQHSATDGTIAAIRLIVSLGMAVLGALFFITNSLRGKRERIEIYDQYKFWSGTWFRLGEAVLFTVVFFLALRREATDSDRLLPLIALLLGMFVTTGETLVFGLAQRVLHAAVALVGIEGPEKKPPRVTGVSKVTAPSTAGGTAVTTVTIDGEAFSQVAGTAILDGYALQPETWTDTRVTFTLPAQHPDGASWPVAPASRHIQVGVVVDSQHSNTMQLPIP